MFTRLSCRRCLFIIGAATKIKEYYSNYVNRSNIMTVFDANVPHLVVRIT